jgi:DNA-directed RNA polymerase specialized sigma24 family protein
VQRETLKQLLDLLGPDEQQAAAEYRKLHERLSRFFEWNHVADPMALADETIDRLGKRATEMEIKGGVHDVSAFALGVARHLLQEEARRQLKSVEISRHWGIHRSISSSEAEEMEDALQCCLAKMQPERRKLLEAYYVYSGNEKAKMHLKLAQEYGLTINALRNRALRARQELEASMRRHLKENSR